MSEQPKQKTEAELAELQWNGLHMEETKPTPRPAPTPWLVRDHGEDRFLRTNRRYEIRNDLFSIAWLNGDGTQVKASADLIVSAVNQSEHVKILLDALGKIASCEKIINGDCVDIAQKSLAEYYRRATEGK